MDTEEECSAFDGPQWPRMPHGPGAPPRATCRAVPAGRGQRKGRDGATGCLGLGLACVWVCKHTFSGCVRAVRAARSGEHKTPPAAALARSLARGQSHTGLAAGAWRTLMLLRTKRSATSAPTGNASGVTPAQSVVSPQRIASSTTCPRPAAHTARARRSNTSPLRAPGHSVITPH